MVCIRIENELHYDDMGSSTSDPGSNHKLLTIGHNNAKYGNDDGIVPGSIYDQKCAICNDSDCDNANAIVFVMGVTLQCTRNVMGLHLFLKVSGYVGNV